MLSFSFINLNNLHASLTNLENQVEEHKKKQEKQFQNYVTHDPTEFAKAKREASDLSDQGSKVIIDNVY